MPDQESHDQPGEHSGVRSGTHTPQSGVAENVSEPKRPHTGCSSHTRLRHWRSATASYPTESLLAMFAEPDPRMWVTPASWDTEWNPQTLEFLRFSVAMIEGRVYVIEWNQRAQRIVQEAFEAHALSAMRRTEDAQLKGRAVPGVLPRTDEGR
jgi:hypothetical protein